MLLKFRATLFALALIASAQSGHAQDRARASIWDLKLGAPITAQPDIGSFRAYACGSNGGPPRQSINGFADFARCPAEASGLREVYFEYDDELEFVARARDREQDVIRYAGTTERGYPIVVSALFDADGILRGERLSTDSRPDYRKDVTDADMARRSNAYQFGALMAARFDIDPDRNCMKSPPAEGESAVGAIFIKLDCEKVDAGEKKSVKLTVRFLRKPGQSGYDPRTPTQLTKGQFESLARLEILTIP